jgi:hypothetical protein
MARGPFAFVTPSFIDIGAFRVREMDWLTFISKVISAIVWPAVAVFVVCKFRRSFSTLLGRLTKAEFPGGVKLEMAVAEVLGNEIPEAPDAVRRDAAPYDPIALRANPAGVIMETWLALIAAAKAHLDLLAPAGSRPNTLQLLVDESYVIRQMHDLGLLPASEYALQKQLRRVRNQAAHDGDARPTPEDAERFRALADKLMFSWASWRHAAEPRN